MSLEKITEMLGLPSMEEVQKLATEKFPTQFGRYENPSGKMFFEIWHGDKGRVGWRKGEGDSVTESEELDYPTAIARFSEHMSMGYTRVFKATTLEDMERERTIAHSKKSLMARTNCLGTYRKGHDFMRVNEFATGVYFIEYGTHQSVYDSLKDLDEAKAMMRIDEALAQGYVREGSQPIRSNAFRFFDDEEKPQPQAEENTFEMLGDFFD